MDGSLPEPHDDEAPHYAAEDARGGEITLNTRVRRLVFIGGLILALAVGLILYFSSY